MYIIFQAFALVEFAKLISPTRSERSRGIGELEPYVLNPFNWSVFVVLLVTYSPFRVP